MYDFHTGKLPHVFDEYFALVSQKHNYNTKLASRSSYSLPKVRTNYGKFNIRFVGSNVWNSISLYHDDEYPPFLGGIQFSLTIQTIKTM